MITRQLKDVAPPETFQSAKRLFARHARIFDLFDHSLSGGYYKEVTDKFIAKCCNANKDFWIYETDMTPIPTSASRMVITRTEKRGPATNIKSASPGKLKYINKRAKKAGLALVDYVEDRRPVLSSRVEANNTLINFSIHALRRFWERNEQGVNASRFDDISITHLHSVSNSNSHLITDGGSFKLRTDLLVPYCNGAFMGTSVMKPIIHWVFENNVLDKSQSKCPSSLGFNAITYIGESQMSRFQRLMCDAIKEGNVSRYHDLASKDFKKTAVEWEPNLKS